MPMTSTKNFRLSSGFGVNSSKRPRWARSMMGSGFIQKNPSNQGRRQIVEQFIDSISAWDKSLLYTVLDDQLQRAAHFVRGELGRGILRHRRAFLQQPEHLAHDLRIRAGEFLADDHHV